MFFKIFFGFLAKISKCSGAIRLIVSTNSFLFFTSIDKPKFFKLLDAIFFLVTLLTVQEGNN